MRGGIAGCPDHRLNHQCCATVHHTRSDSTDGHEIAVRSGKKRGSLTRIAAYI